jgi:hypothetical protein
MKELLKTVKAAAPAKQEKKAAPAKAEAKQTFVPEKGAPYRLLSADHKWFSAYTIAAFIHTGMIGLSKAGSPTARKTGDAELWAKIVGSTAAPYWAKIGRVEDGGVTLKGLTLTAGLFAVYLIIVIFGYRRWLRQYRLQSA